MLRLRLLIGTSAAALCLAGQAAAAPPLVGAVKSPSAWTLGPLDPKTLQPLRGAWSRRVGHDDFLVRSPLGTGVAVNGARTAFLDSQTGRPLRPFTGTSPDAALYWFGGERFGHEGKAKVMADFWEAGSLGYWVTYVDLGSGADTWLDDEPWEVFPEGLIVWDGDSLELVDGVKSGDFRGSGTLLARSEGYAQSAADVGHDRLYLLRFDGTVAQIDHVGTRPKVSYHHVDLSGKPFQAAWAGRGRIVLSGADGVGTIDTRTWTAHAVAGDGDLAIPTRYGIVVLDYDTRGVTVYSPGGARRFTVLADRTVRCPCGTAAPPPIVLGRFLYVIADGQRWTVDLAAGRVVSRARREARLALPSYVALP